MLHIKLLGSPELMKQADKDCNWISINTHPNSAFMKSCAVPPSAPPAEMTSAHLVTELAASSPHPGLA